MVIREPRPLPRVGEMETSIWPNSAWTVLRTWKIDHPIRMRVVILAHRYGSPQFYVYIATQHGLLNTPHYCGTREQADEVFDGFVRYLATQLAEQAFGLNRV